MATVRMTKDLKEQLAQRVRNQFTTRREAITKKFTENFEPAKAQYAEDLLAVILEQHNMPQETYDAIPKGWCHRVRKFKAYVLNNIDAAQLPTVVFPDDVKVPEAIQYSAEQLLLDHPKLEAYANAAADVNAALNALSAEQNHTMAQLNRLLASCATLKQAIDVWPHLLELLPKSVRDEHERPSEKRTRSAPAKIDTDSLTGALVKAKMVHSAMNT